MNFTLNFCEFLFMIRVNYMNWRNCTDKSDSFFYQMNVLLRTSFKATYNVSVSYTHTICLISPRKGNLKVNFFQLFSTASFQSVFCLMFCNVKRGNDCFFDRQFRSVVSIAGFRLLVSTSGFRSLVSIAGFRSLVFDHWVSITGFRSLVSIGRCSPVSIARQRTQRA